METALLIALIKELGPLVAIKVAKWLATRSRVSLQDLDELDTMIHTPAEELLGPRRPDQP